MSQWLGSLQIHDFNQTATRLKEQQQQSTSSSAVAVNDTLTTDVANSTVADSKQPLNLTSDVSCQQTCEETDSYLNLESEVNVPFPIADASSDHKIRLSESSVDESNKISDTIDTVEHTNETEKNDTDMEQITSHNNKDYLQTKN